jgi:hypothetical protein
MGKKVFVFGEEHDKNAETLSYVRESMRMLKERGVKNIAFELPQDWHGEFVKAAKRGAKTLPMKLLGSEETFRRTGMEGAYTGAPSQHLALAREAMQMGLSVQCVDLPSGELVKDMSRTLGVMRKAERGRGKKIETRIQEAGGEATKRDVKETRGVLKDISIGAISTLGRRNMHMATRISEMEGDTILLTGMSHTGGSNGVDQCLRKMGMSVVSTDIYPKETTLQHEVSQAVEKPAVEFRAMGVSRPSQAIIEAKIAALSGRAGRRVKADTAPLRRASHLAPHPRGRLGNERRVFSVISHGE